MRYLVNLLLTVTLAGMPSLPAISLAVTPHVGRSPLTVLAKVSVMQNIHNRGLCLEWAQLLDNGELGETGLSCHSLDGASAPITSQREIVLRASGTYSIVAGVTRDDGTAKRSGVETVEVLDRD